MDRNPEREGKIPRICKEICMPLYTHAIASLNPDILVERPASMGLGDESCVFDLKMAQDETA
jgi:hypothetical protein